MRKKHGNVPAYLSTKRLPFDFIKRLDDIIPKEKRTKVLEVFSQERPTTFRVNTLKANPYDIYAKIKSYKIPLQRVNWEKNAFILPVNFKHKIVKTDEYLKGLIYLQSLSSMIPALILDPRRNEKILDICAAPGSKTTQMAALMENSGEVVANDINQIRLLKLEANLKLQEVKNVIVTKMPAEIIWLKIPEAVDKTLVDAPCSMEGRFDTYDPKTYNHWSTKKVSYLSKHQKWILRSAVSATKVGGIIVYSTCTLAPEENEGVIDWILNKEKGVLTVEKISLPNFDFEAPLLGFKDKNFDPRIKNTVRILPTALMEGFFIAKLRKIKSNIKK